MGYWKLTFLLLQNVVFEYGQVLLSIYVYREQWRCQEQWQVENDSKVEMVGQR